MWVDLDQGEGDAPPLTYSPSRIKVTVSPGAPSVIDEFRIAHEVVTRYHPQISFNTRLTFTDKHGATHQLFVKGIQNVGMKNRTLILLCEEVLTPQ